MYTLYEHVNKINGKRYIGITGRNPQERWGRGGKNYRTTPRFFSAIEKYGWDNFEHNIVKDNLTREEACKMEKDLIKKYRTQEKLFGYNILEGGDTPVIPEEVRQKMSKSKMGNKNGNHPCSEETKEKIRQSLIGKPFSKERKKKLSEAAKKRHVPCSDGKRKTLSKSYPKKCPVFCEETGKTYESVQECARQLNLFATNVSKVCKGKLSHAKGYHLKYSI